VWVRNVQRRKTLSSLSYSLLTPAEIARMHRVAMCNTSKAKMIIMPNMTDSPLQKLIVSAFHGDKPTCVVWVKSNRPNLVPSHDKKKAVTMAYAMPFEDTKKAKSKKIPLAKLWKASPSKIEVARQLVVYWLLIGIVLGWIGVDLFGPICLDWPSNCNGEGGTIRHCIGQHMTHTCNHPPT